MWVLQTKASYNEELQGRLTYLRIGIGKKYNAIYSKDLIRGSLVVHISRVHRK